MKTRHYLILKTWTGKIVDEIASWKPFTDRDIKGWLKSTGADQATTEKRMSLI